MGGGVFEQIVGHASTAFADVGDTVGVTVRQVFALVEHTAAVTVGVGAEFAGIIHTIAIAVGSGAVRNGDRATGVLGVDRGPCIVIAFPEFNDQFIGRKVAATEPEIGPQTTGRIADPSSGKN